MTARAPLRIAHASDIHLDTDYFGGEEDLTSRDYCRGVFLALLEGIEKQAPQLLMLPGDLFDSNRASRDTIEWAMELLSALPWPVVMIPGNHDCLEPGGFFHRHDFGFWFRFVGWVQLDLDAPSANLLHPDHGRLSGGR